ncbi:uncharacterized protein JCM6883_000822 [Sporobolomyces salmoneus]|uniref:uncharacterized protein n=1 Tax=Sporobolomyces salmoneus TaxID=183962 RepID=UPI003181349D
MASSSRQGAKSTDKLHIARIKAGERIDPAESPGGAFLSFLVRSQAHFSTSQVYVRTPAVLKLLRNHAHLASFSLSSAAIEAYFKQESPNEHQWVIDHPDLGVPMQTSFFSTLKIGGDSITKAAISASKELFGAPWSEIHFKKNKTYLTRGVSSQCKTLFFALRSPKWLDFVHRPPEGYNLLQPSTIAHLVGFKRYKVNPSGSKAGKQEKPSANTVNNSFDEVTKMRSLLEYVCCTNESDKAKLKSSINVYAIDRSFFADGGEDFSESRPALKELAPGVRDDVMFIPMEDMIKFAELCQTLKANGDERSPTIDELEAGEVDYDVAYDLVNLDAAIGTPRGAGDNYQSWLQTLFAGRKGARTKNHWPGIAV